MAGGTSGDAAAVERCQRWRRCGAAGSHEIRPISSDCSGPPRSNAARRSSMRR
jgi:hypothetical protein